MRRWLAPCVLFIVSAVWLVWAFPRLHPAAKIGLKFDRFGYLAQARQVAARNGMDLTQWRGYAKAENLWRNQYVLHHLNSDPIAQTFPPANVLTDFVPNNPGSTASVTLRPDGRSLGWKFPPAKNGGKADPRIAAESAVREIAGNDAGSYQLTGDASAFRDETGLTWQRAGTNPGGPQASIETRVAHGVALQAKSTFTQPDEFKKRLDTFPTIRVIFSITWFVLLVTAFIVAVRREGGGRAARAMRDSSALWLSAFVALLVMIANLIEWDDQMVSIPSAPGLTLEILSLLLGATIVGVLIFTTTAATLVNARLHGLRVRGLRLIATRWIFSRTVGGEVLGAILCAPALVAIPLAVAAALRVMLARGFDDGILLNRAPVLDAFANGLGQDDAAVLAFVGVMIPLGLGFTKFRWIRWGLIAVSAFITFAMLMVPFPESLPANLICALLNAALIVWLYFQFGVLGALAAHGATKVITSAAVLLVQPSSALQGSGMGILLALAGCALVALIVTLKGRDASTELAGESGRLPLVSRREELLAEFNVARSAQQQMLPSRFPTLEGYTLAASCEPAREVGGDLYDFLRLNDGRWGIGVADVSGKGVPAALYMTLTKGLLCAAAQDSGNPYEILSVVNKHLRTAAKKKVFVTMALGVLDPAARTMEYARAGHNPVVWRRPSSGETRMLASSGVGLGIATPALFGRTLASERIDLSPGDALVFYSDGLTEAMNHELEQFGDERLMTAVEHADGMPAAATLHSILEEVKDFLGGISPQDDLTIAVLRVNSDFESELSSNGR